MPRLCFAAEWQPRSSNSAWIRAEAGTCTVFIANRRARGGTDWLRSEVSSSVWVGLPIAIPHQPHERGDEKQLVVLAVRLAADIALISLVDFLLSRVGKCGVACLFCLSSNVLMNWCAVTKRPELLLYASSPTNISGWSLVKARQFSSSKPDDIPCALLTLFKTADEKPTRFAQCRLCLYYVEYGRSTVLFGSATSIQHFEPPPPPAPLPPPPLPQAVLEDRWSRRVTAVCNERGGVWIHTGPESTANVCCLKRQKGRQEGHTRGLTTEAALCCRQHSG